MPHAPQLPHEKLSNFKKFSRHRVTLTEAIDLICSGEVRKKCVRSKEKE
jgi:hypothetical protein